MPVATDKTKPSLTIGVQTTLHEDQARFQTAFKPRSLGRVRRPIRPVFGVVEPPELLKLE